MVNRPITSSRVKRLPMLSLSSFSISCMANVHKPTALVGGLVFVFDGLAFIYPTRHIGRSEGHTYELQSLMRISYAVFCLQTNTESIFNPNLTCSTQPSASSLSSPP